MWLAGGFLSAVPGGKSMRPPPVILKGIHSNEPKWNRGPPTFGARGVRLGSQLPTISAIAAVAVSPASNLGLDITPASVSEDFATPHEGKRRTECSHVERVPSQGLTDRGGNATTPARSIERMISRQACSEG